MKHLSRLRPTPALVIALIALFVSLGGVSYGVATGYIDSREIKNGTIRTKDLRNNEVRGIDIRNSTVQGRDVALATITGQDVKESTLSQVPSAARRRHLRVGRLAARDHHAGSWPRAARRSRWCSYGPLTAHRRPARRT